MRFVIGRSLWLFLLPESVPLVRQAVSVVKSNLELKRLWEQSDFTNGKVELRNWSSAQCSFVRTLLRIVGVGTDLMPITFEQDIEIRKKGRGMTQKKVKKIFKDLKGRREQCSKMEQVKAQLFSRLSKLLDTSASQRKPSEGWPPKE